MTYKSDVRAYTYANGAQAHGNQRTGDGYSTVWTAFNMLSTITQGNVTFAHTYDAADSAFDTAGRALELQQSIPLAQQVRITMGVGLAEDANGTQQVLIGTSEPGGYLRPGVTLNPGEILVPGSGHAEADIINYTQQNGLNLLEYGATRPICAACAALGEDAGATPVTPLKGP